MRFPYAVITLSLVILLTGCATQPAPPVGPVQVPQVPAVESAPAPASPTPASEPKRNTEPEQEKKGPQATAPPTVAPAAPTLLPEGAPALLKRLAEADWAFDAIQATLPTLESRYVDRSGENPEYITYVYSQGDLRLYVSGRGELFTLLVGPTFAEYGAFSTLPPGQGYAVYHVGDLIAVSRVALVSAEELAQLAAASWTLDQLRQGLGEPTYHFHYHGLGSFTYVWLPQQLTFYGYGDDLHLQLEDLVAYRSNPSGYAEAFTKSQVSQLRLVDGLLAKGKVSPSGSVRAAVMARGGYWDNWIIVKSTGKAEQRFQADYFILDCHLLDDQTLVYVSAPLIDSELYAIDLTSGEQKRLVKLKGHVTKFGIVAGRRIWYENEAKERHELDLP